MSTLTAKMSNETAISCGNENKKDVRGIRSRNENSLGPNEKLVLLALRNIGHESYGSRINDEIKSRIGEPMKVGALYGTLDRLHRKGFVSHVDSASICSKSSPNTSKRQYFKLTGKGVSALEYSLRIIDLMRFDASPVPV